MDINELKGRRENESSLSSRDRKGEREARWSEQRQRDSCMRTGIRSRLTRLQHPFLCYTSPPLESFVSGRLTLLPPLAYSCLPALSL